VAAGLVKRLVGTPALFGAFRDDGAAIMQDSVHHLEKLVDGAPLRRPWWFFDVRVQGSGPVDIPTHVVDQAQWLVDGDRAALVLLSARAWSTRVPVEAFRRITGEAGFPRELQPFVDGDDLSYRWQAELPGVEVVPAGPETYEVAVPPQLDGGHEAHFARVLDEFLRIVDDHAWPTALAERTLAKYALLAEAAAKTGEP